MRRANSILEFRIISALMLTEATEGIRAIAIPFLVYAGTGNLSSASIVAVCGAVPAVVVGILGSPQVEKLSRKRIIVTANVVRSVLLITLPVAWVHFGLVAVAGVAFISSALGALEKPSMYASLPILFKDDYQGFLGKRVGFSFLVQAVSPAIGGALVGFFGAADTLEICGFMYGVYAVLIVTIHGFDSDHAERAARVRGQESTLMIREALKAASSTPALRTMFVFWFFSIAAVPIGVLSAVPYITENLGLTSVEYGIASACYGTATVLSSLAAGKLKFPGGARPWLLASGMIYGTINLVMGVESGIVIFCLLWFIWGLAYGPEEVVGQLVFVRAAPAAVRGRMFSLMTVVMSSGLLVGNAVAGPLSDGLGPQWAMVCAGVVFIFATFLSFGIGKGANAISQIVLYDDDTSVAEA
ncbi:MAG: MFS transporter [Ancrocorticia sp.]|uniref:MFS transporter n=1 Tax=Ancrocorticia sp. TaxID=2593684 RepID=UPI003F91E712